MNRYTNKTEELNQLNKPLRNRNKMKDDTIAQLSDQSGYHQTGA
jgi:hypothetical protein